jgi:hypothetical protein
MPELPKRRKQKDYKMWLIDQLGSKTMRKIGHVFVAFSEKADF